MVKRIISMLVMLLLIGCLAVTAFATHPVPDLSQNGSITFVMELDGVLLDGGRLNLYRVGDVVDNDGDYTFGLIDELDGSDLNLEDVNDPILAEELLTIAKVVDLEKLSAPIENGGVTFTDLPNGLYVVWQDAEDATKGFAAIQPFLITVPMFRDGAYETDVIAKPKVPLETEPAETTEPTEPTTPTDDELPQTGQLNWPVPVLAIGGAVLLILGFVLRTAGKKESADA